ncbi:hypothetical protein ACLUYG_00365 [Limosilactobacillus reuteri subsp. suis]|uniref:hypothetical protein n=1 Tax=Limosilactobacillus reuteri TaxID=1598 RepID=UPI0039968118
MSLETKVLSASTRTNLEALKHYMKKLGYSKFHEDARGWIKFGSAIEYVNVHLDTFMYDISIWSMEKAREIAEINQAILDFYEAEGIKE